MHFILIGEFHLIVGFKWIVRFQSNSSHWNYQLKPTSIVDRSNILLLIICQNCAFVLNARIADENVFLKKFSEIAIVMNWDIFISQFYVYVYLNSKSYVAPWFFNQFLTWYHLIHMTAHFETCFNINPSVPDGTLTKENAYNKFFCVKNIFFFDEPVVRWGFTLTWLITSSSFHIFIIFFLRTAYRHAHRHMPKHPTHTRPPHCQMHNVFFSFWLWRSHI